MSPVFKAHTALFLAALIYGGNYTIAKEVLDNEHIQPFGFILMRVICGMVLFSLLHLLFIREKIEGRDIGLFLLCGLFGVAINQLLFFKGLKMTTHIHAALIMTTTPILVLIASAILLKEQITSKKMLGIALGAVGAVILIIYGKKFAYKKEGMFGDVFIFINATSYGIYLVLVKKLMRKYHPLTVIKWVFTIGFFFVGPLASRELMNIQWNTFTPGIWLAVAYVLFFTTFLTYLFNAYALKIVNPSVVSIYIYLQPLLATAIALFFVKDELTLTKLGAGLFIFAGVYFVSKR